MNIEHLTLLERLELLRKQVDLAIAMESAGMVSQYQDFHEFEPGVMEIGDFRISPRFPAKPPHLFS